jgi:transposase-like protein
LCAISDSSKNGIRRAITELKADESYFGPPWVRGVRGRGAGFKTVVFGLLKRGSSVYTEIVPNASKAILQAICRGKADVASVIHADHWRGYDAPVDVGFDKHLRVNLNRPVF